MKRKNLQALTLVELNRENLVPDLLAVQHHDNRLYKSLSQPSKLYNWFDVNHLNGIESSLKNAFNVNFFNVWKNLM